MFIYSNLNPLNLTVGDCVVRAISAVLNQDWDTTYIGLATKGYEMADMPSANSVWGAYLRDKGLKKSIMPNTCPDCYTVRQFSDDHPHGRYLLSVDSHVVAVINGNYYDTWDSGDKVPIYYYKK